MNNQFAVEVRSAHDSDLETIAFLYFKQLEFHLDLDSRFNPSWATSLEAKAFLVEYISDENRLLAVAEIERQIVGYAYGAVKRTPLDWNFRHIAELESLHVSKNFRGLGVGQDLTKRFVEFSKERRATRLKIESFSGNLMAINYWEKLGFKQYSINLDIEL